jgi:uncharacterized membrane protein
MGLTIHNATTKGISVAIAWADANGHWKKEGWYNINANSQQVNVIKGNLTENKYYAYYAVAEDGHVWASPTEEHCTTVKNKDNFGPADWNEPYDTKVCFLQFSIGTSNDYTLTIA